MERDKFEQFLRDHKHKIYNYLLRFVDINEDAQDLLQEVFIAFYERIEEIEPETALAYTYRIAHNKALNMRKAGSRYILKPVEALERMPSPSIEPDHSMVVNKAIARLPVKLSTVVHLFYFDKLSYREIAVQLKISVKAVDSLLNRARRKLRRDIVISNEGTFGLRT